MNFKAALKPFQFAARRLVGNRLRVLRVVAVGTQKAIKNPEVLKEIWGDFQTLLAMIGAWARRDYRNVPTKSIVLGLAAVLYFISPLDLIPDFLPGGFLDDLAVLTLVLASLRADIAAFRLWKNPG